MHTGWCFTRAALALAVALVACSDSSAPVEPDAAGDGLPEGIAALRDVEAPLPGDDFDALLPIIGDADLIGLGEAVHTTRGFSRMKARAFTYLVERANVRVFAFENPRFGAEQVQSMLERCTAGTVSDVATEARAAASGLFGVWANDSVAELIEWMCAYNGTHPSDPLLFSGFDVQEPCRDALDLREYLASVGVDGLDDLSACDNVPEPLVCGSLAPAAIGDAEHAQCIARLDAIDAAFSRQRDELIARSSERALAHARVAAISLRAWQQSNYLDQRVDFIGAAEARDAGMAASFGLLRDADYGDRRVALWAHNWHLAVRNDAVQDELSFRNLGTHLAERYGPDYVPIALVAYDVGVDWPGVHTGDIPVPTGERSVERLLDELGSPALVVDATTPFFEAGQPYSIGTEPAPTAIPQIDRVISEHFAGLIFLSRAEPMRPLLW